MKPRLAVAIVAMILSCGFSLSSAPAQNAAFSTLRRITPLPIPCRPLPAPLPLLPDLPRRSLPVSELRPAAAGFPIVDSQRRFLSGMPYGAILTLSAERHGLDSLLLAAMVDVESGFSVRAVSPQGAQGLMQVIRSTAREMGSKGDLLDPYTNVEAGSHYMSDLLRDFHGDLGLSLAAYNAGPSAVQRHKGIPPYRETRDYVRRVLGRYRELQVEMTGERAGNHSETVGSR
jgi:soluble lytic murein transglycosylase-like protein